MLKKIFLSVLGVSLALSISLFTVGASSNKKSQSSSSGTESSQAAKSSSILADVDSQKIYESDFRANLKAYRAAAAIQSGNVAKLSGVQARQKTALAESAPKSDRELLQSMIKVQVITEDCAKAGIRVSRDEAKAALQKNLKTFQDLMQNGDDLEKKQAREAWDAYGAVARAMGITLDEYNADYGITATQTLMIESRHYQHFVSGLSRKDLTQEQIHSLYDQYVQGLIQKSSVTVNEALLNSIQ